MPNDKDSGELMYIRCAYCRAWVDVKPGKMTDVTHTICAECARKVLADFEKKAGPKTTRKTIHKPRSAG